MVHDHRRPLILLAVAVVARVAYWVLATPRYVPISDAGQYYEIARNLASGHGFDMHFPQITVHPTAFRPPLYPGLLALVYWIFGASITAGRCPQPHHRGGGRPPHLPPGRPPLRPRAGFIAGLAVALYPPLLANDVTLLTEPLSLVLILGLLLALDARRVLLAGALCGLLVLARPSAQGIAVVVGLWVLWSFGLRRCLQFVGLAIVVVAPWIVRNWVQIGSPVLVTSNGFNLAAMYSPAAEARGAFVDPVYDPSFDKLRLAQFDEVGWQRDLQHMAITNLEAHPRQPASVFARNSAAFFELRPSFNRTAEVEDGRNLLFVTWTLPLFYVMTVVGLAGVVLLWRRHRTRSLATLMILATAYFTFASLFLVAPPRLRAPFDLLCCIGFGVAVDAALRRWAPGEQQRAGSGAASAPQDQTLSPARRI